MRMNRKQIASTLAAVAIALHSGVAAPGTCGDGAWIDATTADVSWTDASKWENGIVGCGVDKTADFANGLNHTTGKTVDLAVDIVIGQIIYRDSGSVNRDISFSSQNGSRLLMTTTTGSPLIWAKNRSINVDVAIAGTNGLSLRSDQGKRGVVLMRRNSYTGLTTVEDDDGYSRLVYPGDVGDSDVLVRGGLRDADPELVIGHGLGLKPTATLTIEAGATVDLDYPNMLPGVGDAADLYVKALVVGGIKMSAGIYSAASLPTYFTGDGEIVVQPTRPSFSLAVRKSGARTNELSWPSLYGRVYDVWETTNITLRHWTNLATVKATPPLNRVSLPSLNATAFYRVEERVDYLSTVRAGVIERLDGFISNNYLTDQNTDPADIRFGQFHNSDNMRMAECTPVLVWAYMQPDSQHYMSAAVLDSAIWSVDYMVRAQGSNGGFNEHQGWCGGPHRTAGKSSVTGFTLHAIGDAITLLAGLPEMQSRLLENIDANGTGSNDTQRLQAWTNMLARAMPYQFSGNGRGHAPNQDLCALEGVYSINDAYAALTGGILLKTQPEIDGLAREVLYGQPSAARTRPDGRWFSDTGLLAEAGHGFFGYDGNYGARVSMEYLALLALHDAQSAGFLSTKYAEALQYFFVPDENAWLGVFAENAISRRSTGDPMDTGMLPYGLAHDFHPAMERLYQITLPYFANAPVANMPFKSPHMFQVGVWMYCEWLDHFLTAPSEEVRYWVPAERNEAWVFEDSLYKTRVTKPEGGVVTYYSEIWDDPNQARRHVWGQAPETIPSLGLFP